jgi:hypothetical protein
MCHTTDIYEKIKIRRQMYSNDEKTDMILIYGECNKNVYAVVFMETIYRVIKKDCLIWQYN